MAKQRRRAVISSPRTTVEVLKNGEVIATTTAGFTIYGSSDHGVDWEGEFLGSRSEFDPWELMGDGDIAIRLPGVGLVGPIVITNKIGRFRGNGPPPMPLP